VKLFEASFAKRFSVTVPPLGPDAKTTVIGPAGVKSMALA
jgi:hypothetical protein